MKKTKSLLLISFLSIVSIFLLAPHNTYAALPSQIQIDKIDHIVTPIYGGLLLINDTIKVSPATTNATVENLAIGFPLKYRTNLYHAMAYDAEKPDKQLDVILDTGLGVIGYYGITVTFPDEVRSLLYNGQPYTFTVTFVFSNLTDSSTNQEFTIDFPLYPSLAQETLTCNVTVILPKNTNYTNSDFPFNATQRNNQYYLNYEKSPLPKLTQASTHVSFVAKDSFALFSLNKLNREITIDVNQHISVTELAVLKSKTASAVSSVRLQLPKDAGNVSAFNGLGEKIKTTVVENETNVYEVSLNFVENQSRSFRLTYDLDRENHLIQQDAQNYKLNLSLSVMQMIPKTFTLKIVFPEGAAVKAFPQKTFNIQRDVFRDTLSISLSDDIWLQNEQWSFTYSYTVFWASFRPTLWATTLVIIGVVIALAWQRPRGPEPISIVLVPRKTLNNFVEAYEEKKRVLSDLEQAKQRAQKGRISRRRYKVRKTTLENRLSTLSRRLIDLRHKIMSGGAKYADIMRQLEVAETELDNIEADIRRIEVRFKRGEISTQTYRRLIENDSRRKEKAKTTIDGVLLRLRE